MKEPQPGVDYLIDYYALLEVPRQASISVIKRAYREKLKENHPDRFQGLAADFQTEAQRRTQVLLAAFDVLSQPSKRQAYDQQLADWTGPLSRDGNPVMSLSTSAIDVSWLLSETDDQTNLWSGQAEAMSGWNERIHKLLQKQYESLTTSDPELEQAYAQSLAQLSKYAALREAFNLMQLGLPGEISDTTSDNYLADRTAQLTAQRRQVMREVTGALRSIENGTTQALGPGSQALLDGLTTNPAATIRRYQRRASNRLNSHIDSTLQWSSTRETANQQRLELIRGEYRPTGQPLHDRVAVCVKVGTRHVWLAFTLVGNNAQQDEDIPTSELEKLTNARAAQRMIASGRNVLFCDLPADLPVQEALYSLLEHHFSAYLASR